MVGKMPALRRDPKAFHDGIDNLVKGLLEWRPDKRLGGGKHANSPKASADVKAHKYWQAPEWELVELRRLPSPLLKFVEARAKSKPSDNKLKKQQRAAIETAGRIATVDAKTALARRALGESGAAGSDAIGVDEELQDRLHVPDWDFVSKHAIEQEYVETIASSVALI